MLGGIIWNEGELLIIGGKAISEQKQSEEEVIVERLKFVVKE